MQLYNLSDIFLFYMWDQIILRFPPHLCPPQSQSDINFNTGGFQKNDSRGFSWCKGESSLIDGEKLNKVRKVETAVFHRAELQTVAQHHTGVSMKTVLI